MKRLLKYFKEYFIFTRSEIRGTVALLIIIAIIMLLRWVLPFYTGKYYNRINDVEFIKADSFIESSKLKVISNKDTAAAVSNDSVKPVKAFKTETKSGELFNFNPNTVSYDELIKLGFTSKVAATFIKYRNAGAHFKKPADIKRVYGMTDEFYQKIEAYIVIQ